MTVILFIWKEFLHLPEQREVSRLDLASMGDLAHPLLVSVSAQSCPTLCESVDCSPPGSSVHGIFQARVLEWGAIAFSESALRIGS